MYDYEIKKQLIASYDNSVTSTERNIVDKWKQTEVNKFLHYHKNINSMKLLDIGAGTGIYGQIFKKAGFDVTCIDISPKMIQSCEEKGLNAIVMDLSNLNFKEESFDTVWSMNSLLHIPNNDIERVLVNIKEVLKNEGIFYFGIYGGYDSEGIWEDDSCNPKRFFSFYTNENLKYIVNKFFKVISFNNVKLKNNNLIYQSLILQKINSK